MRPFLFFFLVAGLVTLSFGQSAETDSLKKLIEKESDNTRKVELLNALSFAFFASNIELGNSSTEAALELAHKIGDTKGEAWALTYRGLYFQLSGMLPEANHYYQQSFEVAKNTNDYNLQTYALTQMGNAYLDKGAFDTARHFYQQAMRIGPQAGTYYQSVTRINVSHYYQLIHKPDSAIHFVQEALALRGSLNDPVLVADGWILLGNCYRAKDDYSEAEKLYQQASEAAPGDLIIQADYLQNMGEIHFIQGDFQRALENWTKVLELHRQYQYRYVLGELLFRMGAVFQEQGYFDLASEYLTRALSISEKAGYQYLTGKIYNELAWLHYRSLNFELARKKNQIAEKILKRINADLEVAACWDLAGLIERNLKHYDTALYYHTKSLQARMLLKDKTEISDGNFNLGEFYLKTGNPKAALSYYRKSLALDKSLKAGYGMSLNYNRMGRIYTELSRFDSAKIYFDKSLELAIPTSSNDIFRDNYLDLAAFYEKQGQAAKAIPYYKKYSALSDSLFSKQAAQSIASYQILHDVERNERKIELLNKDNQLNRAQVKQQRLILYSVLAGFVGLCLLAASYYRFNNRLKKLNSSLADKNEEIQIQTEVVMKANEALNKLNREIAEQKEEIQAQAEELVENNQIISNINHSLEQRIEERTQELKQAYKELDTFFYRSSHDFRRPLTTFMGLAEVGKITVKDKTALELLDKVNETARNLDKMLMKLQSISDLGVQELIFKEVSIKEIFNTALKLVDHELLQRNIQTQIEVEDGLSFYSYPALIKIIVENLVENAVAFCGFNTPFISLKSFREKNEIVIQVEDNGQGIDKTYRDRVFDMYFRGTERSKGNGLGLYIVKKTADKLKSRVVLQSEAGKGTTVSIFFPIKSENV